MRKDEQIKIMYASKYAGVENSYKKWKGEVLGLTVSNAVAKKRAYETDFQRRIAANPSGMQSMETSLLILTELIMNSRSTAWLVIILMKP
jgi:hypothetical protein